MKGRFIKGGHHFCCMCVVLCILSSGHEAKYIQIHIECLKKVRRTWYKQVFGIYSNDFNLTKTIPINSEHFGLGFFTKKNQKKKNQQNSKTIAANKCIKMMFILNTPKKIIYMYQKVYPFLSDRTLLATCYMYMF